MNIMHLTVICALTLAATSCKKKENDRTPTLPANGANAIDTAEILRSNQWKYLWSGEDKNGDNKLDSTERGAQPGINVFTFYNNGLLCDTIFTSATTFIQAHGYWHFDSGCTSVFTLSEDSAGVHHMHIIGMTDTTVVFRNEAYLPAKYLWELQKFIH